MSIQSISNVNYRKNYITNQAFNTMNPVNTLLRKGNINPYNVDTEEELLQKRDYSNLVKFQDHMTGTNNSVFVEKYLNLPSFNELVQSKYFNSPNNFKKLTSSISKMEREKQDALRTVSSWFYRPGCIPDVLSYQAQTDVGKCIDNINKLFKSKISDDLKEYIRDSSQILSDWKITSVNLGYLDPENPEIAFLNPGMFAFM